MAGSLPGVETARRRRIHQSSGCPGLGVGYGYTRRPAFCLYTTNNETHFISASSFVERSAECRASLDEKMEPVAREAKERLDERLRTPRRSDIRRNNSDLSEERLRSNTGKRMMIRDLHAEVFGSKPSGGDGGGGSRRFWAKFGWKPWEQEECAVCLEQFKVGENLVNLSCAHKFHSRCLVPWLIGNNSHCPCCRKLILSEN
ncbi:putative E3 ubiquitin-protein ligase RHY1A [Drosera capensis]